MLTINATYNYNFFEEKYISHLSTSVQKIIHDHMGPSLQAPGILYHYTDAYGLKGIIEEKKIRATHVAFMNDSDEYMHAVLLFKEELEKRRLSTNDEKFSKFFEALIELLSITHITNFYPFFIACFSVAKNSLNQWRAYGKGEGGFSLGLDSEALYGFSHKLPGGGGLVPVIYSKASKLQLINTCINFLLREYEALINSKDINNNEELRKHWAEVVLEILAYAAPLFKQDEFHEESEWRLIWRVRYEDEKLIQFLPKSTFLSAYVNLDFSLLSLPLRAIDIGPGRYKEMSLVATRALCRNNNLPDDIINQSNIGYRVTS